MIITNSEVLQYVQLRALFQNGIIRGSEKSHKKVNNFYANKSKGTIDHANCGGDGCKTRRIGEKGHEIV